MQRIDFYLDFISPYAYLAFERLPLALEGLSYEVRYRPILFKHDHAQSGLAAITAKRNWIRRHTLWLARQMAIDMQWPAAHPFKPLALLRLAWACARQGTPSRYVCETILRHVWQGGAAADDAARLRALTEALAPAHDPAGDAVKAQLRGQNDAAIAAGIFGVPAFTVDGRLFWGLDSLPMLRAHLMHDPALDALWDAPARVAAGVKTDKP